MSAIAFTNLTNFDSQQERQYAELSSQSQFSNRKIIKGEIGCFDCSRYTRFSTLLRSSLSCISGLLYLRVLFELHNNSAEPCAIVFPKRTAILSYGALLLLIIPLVNIPLTAAGQAEGPVLRERPDDELPPSINDSDLTIETVATELNRPTAMAFLGPDDILVLDKDNGTVRRIIDGEVQEQPLLDVAVANDNGTNERGMLGLAVAKPNQTTTYVFLYYTESGGGQDGDDSRGIVPAGNRLYRYELVETAGNNGTVGKLINPKLLLDLPSRPGPRYNGGPLLVAQGENNTTNVYLNIGDLDHHRTQAQNYEDGPPPDGTGGILRVDIEGNAVRNPLLIESNDEESGMLEYYFAYGIRNSFGMDFDPVSGFLWDTENGADQYDEINIVEPGFNSGWEEIQGLASAEENEGVEIDEDLEDFDGTGIYSDPKFVWNNTVGVTALKFLNSTGLGEEYQNDMFVADINNGRLYHFDLNEERTDLILGGVLSDKVADNPSELDSVIFGTGFRSISDIEVGPDGYLYLLLYGPGKIFKIAPTEEQQENQDND
jgi:glucose/arabinose dehydrogenase